MADIFISYASADTEFALKLAQSLRSAGANLWIDRLDIQAGDHWDLAVEQALEKAKILLIVLSPAAVDSKNVMDEVSFALEENKRIVPVLYKPCKIPFRLRRVHHVDFGADFDHALKRLLNDLAIKEAAEERQPAHPVPGEQLAPPYQPMLKEESPQQSVLTNSIGMEFILIPAGSFTMGSRLTVEELLKRFGGEKRWYESEKPFHSVKIKHSFYLQTTPVTQGQWQRLIGDNPSYFKDGGEDCPVEQVSWKEAQQFIKKLNQVEKTKDYRLPSEAEWEYACRAGSEAEFFFGDDVERLDEFAWYFENSGNKTHRVGEKKPNGWGLYDMHGNIWEWVEDDWHDSYEGAPDDGRAWVDKPRGSCRVIRGGSWSYDARCWRSATRDCHGPDGRNGLVGFRFSRSIPLGP
jgi:formylglycine-generating enzyme required for sulfatase activity